MFSWGMMEGLWLTQGTWRRSSLEDMVNISGGRLSLRWLGLRCLSVNGIYESEA